MPSAEHAPASQAGPPGRGAAPVIPLASRRRRTTAAHAAPTPAPPAEPEPPALGLALHLQATFLATGQSLADPATAQAYDTTLANVQMLLDGARARGILGAAEQQALRAMVDDMRQAPELV
ncbi:hypothetical protein [Streptomyces hydrogenans]|uniref:hypothetical protein n=1 Tax=Streptomyces hydrogenans TaxID=1873719 RepID=UPI0036EBA461